MRFIFTDVERYCEDEYQDGGMLSEQTGWWFSNGDILIWTRGQSKLKQIGVAVHEACEYIMMHKLKMNGNVSHFVSNLLEFAASLGTTDQYWGKQEWKKRGSP